MAESHADLLETHIEGRHTKLWVVRGDDCPALRQRHIAHVGVGDVAVPYRIVRTNLSGAYLHGSLGGEGRMLLDGRWCTYRPGTMSLAPAHVLHAFHAIPSKRWNFCWVRYTPKSPRSMVHAIAPILAQFDCRPLSHAILGLATEMRGAREMAVCALWVDLVERYVDDFAEPWRREKRLLAVWNAVRHDLSRRWTSDELAELAGVSCEHLRRLCRASFGRSPTQQLTNLRVQYAAHQLATTSAKLDAIADSVGYGNPFAFSNVFKRVTGVRPSSFRTRKQGSVQSGEER